jgi:hypothetical protein
MLCMLCVVMLVYAQAQAAVHASTRTYDRYNTKDHKSSTCCFLLLCGVTADSVTISRLTTHAKYAFNQHHILQILA